MKKFSINVKLTILFQFGVVFLLLPGSCQIRKTVLWQLGRDCWPTLWSKLSLSCSEFHIIWSRSEKPGWRLYSNWLMTVWSINLMGYFICLWAEGWGHCFNCKFCRALSVNILSLVLSDEKGKKEISMNILKCQLRSRTHGQCSSVNLFSLFYLLWNAVDILWKCMQGKLVNNVKLIDF